MPTPKRLIGLDVGDKRIGVAVSDPLGITAQALGVVERVGGARDIDALLALLEPYDVDRVVVGLPLQMDGTEGTQARRVRAFAERLHERTDIAIVFQDERMTSVQSERVLIDAGVRRARRRRGTTDKMAAALILQAYLDAGVS